MDLSREKSFLNIQAVKILIFRVNVFSIFHSLKFEIRRSPGLFDPFQAIQLYEEDREGIWETS